MVVVSAPVENQTCPLNRHVVPEWRASNSWRQEIASLPLELNSPGANLLTVG
jgi:hypothetical protein